MNAKFQRVTSPFVRLLLVVLVLSIALLFAIIQGGFVLWFIFFMLLPFVIYSIFVFITPINDFSIVRHTDTGRLEQGDAVQIKMTLQRKSILPILFIVVQEKEPKGIFSQLEQQTLRKIVPIGFKRQVNWYYKLKNLPRGKHELYGVQLSIVDFLGWVQKTNYVKAPNTLIVYPKIKPLTFEKIISSEQGQLSLSRRSQLQQSTMVSSIREYSPGDRMSWIHWKSFAKTGELQTKEFEQQQNEDACIVLDGLKGQCFEKQISLTASILHSVCEEHEKVGFLSAGKERVVFDSIQSQKELHQALLHLAIIEPTQFNPLHIYSQDHFLREANAIVFITSGLTTEWFDILSRLKSKTNLIKVYTVRNENQQLFAEEVAIENQATSCGIIMQTISEADFSSYGKGGMK